MIKKSPLLYLLLITAYFIHPQNLFAQRSAPIYKTQNTTVLEFHDSKAKSYYGKNLNRFGLDELHQYDQTLDSSFEAELKDTLLLMEKTYLSNSSTLQSKLQEHKRNIENLTIQKTETKAKYDKLLRSFAISFGIWLIITLLFLQFKRRKLKKQEFELAKTEDRFLTVKSNLSKAENIISKYKLQKNSYLRLKEESDQLLNTSIELESENEQDESWTSKQTSEIQKIVASTHFETRLIDALISQENEINREYEATDINKLCEEFVEIFNRGMLQTHDEYDCQITKDFEKNLPAVKTNHGAIGYLLLNLLSNSLKSIEEKYKKGIKGYQPKISISTRILPRFLQIRIKDNGTGMTDDILTKAMDEFYSTREPKEGSGLGLTISKQIISEFHKGEIKIESESGNSTDVYIKFFIS